MPDTNADSQNTGTAQNNNSLTFGNYGPGNNPASINTVISNDTVFSKNLIGESSSSNIFSTSATTGDGQGIAGIDFAERVLAQLPARAGGIATAVTSAVSGLMTSAQSADATLVLFLSGPSAPAEQATIDNPATGQTLQIQAPGAARQAEAAVVEALGVIRTAAQATATLTTAGGGDLIVAPAGTGAARRARPGYRRSAGRVALARTPVSSDRRPPEPAAPNLSRGGLTRKRDMKLS